MTTNEELRYDDGSNSSNFFCSPQACCAYFIMAFSGLLLFMGIFLSFYFWQYMWLVISCIGIILLFVGSCMYYCMVDRNASKRLNQQRKRLKQTSQPSQQIRQENEDLLPTAPLHNAFSSASQLCLLPAFIASTHDDSSIVNLPIASSVSQQNYNQIVLNGQNFLLVPMNADGSIADTTSLISHKTSQPDGPPIELRSDEASMAPTEPARNLTENSDNNRVSRYVTHVPASTSVVIDNLSQSGTANAPSQVTENSINCQPSSHEQLYVTILSGGDNNDECQSNSLISNINTSPEQGNCTIQHSNCSETVANSACEQTNAIDSPTCDSTYDVSSNASTVVDTLCSNSIIPTVNLTPAAADQESQILVDVSDENITSEVRALGGATGLNVNHPDYVSASDDDSVSCGRSSPPPSYAEVAKEDGFSAV